MRQVATIAWHALRTTLRSRVVLVLLALLLAAAFLLPTAIRHDGTPEGLIRVHLTYTLGIAGFLLSLATLWAGCAAISQEADDKTLQLLLVKPIPRLSIWLGKWLALVAMNVVLLALVGAVTLAALHVKLRQGSFDPADLARARLTTLAALETRRAPLPEIDAEVRAAYVALQARGAIPPDAHESVILDSLRRTRLAQRYSIAPGDAHTWTFDPLPTPPPYLLVQFRCDTSLFGAGQIDSTLTLASGEWQRTHDIHAMPGTLETVLFDDTPDQYPGPINVVFHNPGTHNTTLFFDPSDGLVLRFPIGTFTANYLRALASLFLRLALFAAIGTTLGTLFSMPVAAFLSLVLILVLLLSGFISAAAQVDRQAFVANVAPFGHDSHSHDGDAAADAPPSAIARAVATAFYYAYRSTWLALRPLIDYRAVDDLAAATYIPPRAVVRDLLQQGLLFPALLALLSTAVLRQREWALPTLS